MSSALVLLRLLSLLWVGTLLLGCTLQVHAQDTKETTCCKKASRAYIRKEITGCMILPKTYSCAAAVMFDSYGRKFCSDPNVKWVKIRLNELEKKGTPCLDQRNNVSTVGM